MEEDYALTQTASQVQQNLERGSGAQVDQKVSELVQFLLVKDQKKIPIRRADILKHVIKDYKEVYSKIVNRASRTLQQVFGLQLMEIDTKRHLYILVSNLPRLAGENLKQDNRTAKLGLLTVILSFIYMKGNAAKESEVWEMLKKLGVEPGKRHEVFGDVRELVTVEFVQQKYLEYSRMPRTEQAKFGFQCGGAGHQGDLQDADPALRRQDPEPGPHSLGQAVQRGSSCRDQCPWRRWPGQPGGMQEEVVSLVRFTSGPREQGPLPPLSPLGHRR
ncbi:non-structural maintenance of chromosomes element 3 homolog [Macrochelys suwanniensis]